MEKLNVVLISEESIDGSLSEIKSNTLIVHYHEADNGDITSVLYLYLPTTGTKIELMNKNHTHNVSTETSNGFMSIQDKINLNSVMKSEFTNQADEIINIKNSINTINGSLDVLNTVTFKGSNIEDVLEDHTLRTATNSNSGFMSYEDFNFISGLKTNLDNNTDIKKIIEDELNTKETDITKKFVNHTHKISTLE